MKKTLFLVEILACFLISAEQDFVELENNKTKPEIVVLSQDQDAQKNEISVEPQANTDIYSIKESVDIKNKRETTCAIIKPDAVAAGYTGQIIDLIEKNGFTIIRMEKRTLALEQAKLFYVAHKEKPFYSDLVAYMSSGPIIILELEKENALADWRVLIGQTDPEQASVGTIRKMFGVSKTHNAVHGSDSNEAAFQEIKLLFDTL